MLKDYHLIRNSQAGSMLESMLVSAVVTILAVRFLLHVTDYPILGGNGFHIAHMLWGGFLMLLSLVGMLAFLSQRIKRASAIIGGVGFGLFIDELGKFITSDNNYFYQPTIALLYLIFVSLFFLIRYIEKSRPLSQKEYLMNALVQLEEAVLNDMDREEKEKYQQFLTQAGNNHYLTKQLFALTDKLDISLPRPNLLAQKITALSRIIESFLNSKLFHQLIISLFILQFVIASLTVILVIILRLQNTPYSINPISDEHVYTAWGEFISTLISGVLACGGVFFLLRNKLKALLFFKHSVLVTILLTTFFSFYRVQFAALFGLGTNIVLLVGLNNMISQQKALSQKQIPK
jgi:hypothetical protein